MALRHVLWQTGPSQSNGWGVNPGETGPDLAAVPYWDTLIGTSSSVALGPLKGAAGGGHGKDYTVGRALYARGYRPIYVNISRGSSFSNQWIPPSGLYYANMIAEVVAAWAAIRAAYPGDVFVHHHISDQGEAEARYGFPAPDAAEIAVINAWASNYAATHAALESTIGAPMQRWVIQTNSLIDNKVLPGVLEALQLSAAQDALHLINRNPDQGVAYESDGVHMTTAGYIRTGEIFAAQFIQANPMGTLTTFARTSLLAHARNKAAYSAAATHYFHLKVGGSYVSQSGTGYAPLSRTNNTTNWPNAAARVKSNGVALTWASPSGNWGSVDGIEVTDSATPGGGNILASDTFTAVPVGNTAGPGSTDTGPFSIGVGSFTITAASHVSVGGFVDSVVHSLLNLMFGAVAYSAPVTTYGSYWAGDPAGAGAQAGSRVALTQASVWGTAAAGLISSAADVTLAHQGTGTYWAEHDASSSGNLLYCAPRPGTVGAAGTILTGQLQTQLT